MDDKEKRGVTANRTDSQAKGVRNMIDAAKHSLELPFEQHAIRSKCFHPSGLFVEFPITDVESSIPPRFAKIVSQYPNQLAIKSERYRWTYKALNEAANRIAGAVLGTDEGSAGCIGVLCDNDAPLVATLIGVLKAGKIILLLDPSLPKARITKMLADAQAQRIICDSNNEDFARSTVGDDNHLINCERLDPNIPVSSPWPSVSADDIAFIFYTSGSTGVSKGVVHHHRTMLHNVMLRTNSAHFCWHDRIALPRSGTSAAVANLLTATLNGAALYPFNFKKEGAARLARWFAQEEITACTLSAPLFRSLADVDNLPSLPHMRVVQFSSQAMLPSDVALYKKLFAPVSVLINRLSSSETGPMAEYVMDHGTVISEDVIPVGYAQQDKQILLLDDDGNSLGFDQIGEIVVNSSYLSPGYWRNSNLTETKFKADPRDPSKSLYHTGDMGLMRPDGCLVHMGRKDFRVKVRGYGVDISEIENVLRDHAGIKEAVVMLRGNNGQDDRLVAYLVPKGNPSLSASDLRKYLKSRLPDSAVPSRLIAVEHFPLTPNGKIDRQALPDPGNARPDLDTPYSPPSTERELRLASLWAEALSVDQVGIHDNFFDLGGHSLAASRLIARLIDTFQLELPIKALFDAPTVADMAAIIAENEINGATDAVLERMLGEIEAMTEENAKKKLHEIH